MMTTAEMKSLLSQRRRDAKALNKPDDIPSQQGVYVWYSIKSGEILYVGKATGRAGLRGRIWRQHLNPKYLEPRAEKFRPVDKRGKLADGRDLKGHDGLAAVLKADPGAFAECLAEKMLIYALGRGLDRDDRKTVTALAQRMAREDYRFSSLILGIVESESFRTRK